MTDHGVQGVKMNLEEEAENRSQYDIYAVYHL